MKKIFGIAVYYLVYLNAMDDNEIKRKFIFPINRRTGFSSQFLGFTVKEKCHLKQVSSDRIRIRICEKS